MTDPSVILPMEMTDLTEYHGQLDLLEAVMLQEPKALLDMPLQHNFTPGLYIRQIFNPAGTLIVTKIHKTEHPFMVVTGKLSVYVPGEGVQHIQAPYMGVTKPGTRRVIFAHEDTVFVTYHPNPDNIQDLEVLEDMLIERRELMDGKSSYELAQELMAAVRLTGDTE